METFFARNIAEVLEQGCWTPVETFGEQSCRKWNIDNISEDGSSFSVDCDETIYGQVSSTLIGRHNRLNAIAAIAAARHAGVPITTAIEALAHFKGVKRRMELRGEVNSIRVYDDFAHHPTAITETVQGVRAAVGDAKIWAVLAPRSNTMRMGVHKQQLAASLKDADEVILYQPEGLDWDMQPVVQQLGKRGRLLSDIDAIVQLLSEQARAGDHILVMSNGAFGGIHGKLLETLNSKA